MSTPVTSTGTITAERTTPLVELRNLTKVFPVRGGVLQRQVGEVRAVDGVDLDVRRGEALGLVGESGCGKTTLGRMLVRLLEPTDGTILFDEDDVTHARSRDLERFRQDVQIIFQDPSTSLDPRAQVGSSIAEGLRIHRIGNRAERRQRVGDMLELVGLKREHAER